jgi:hypothetical protein
MEILRGLKTQERLSHEIILSVKHWAEVAKCGIE